MCSKVKNWFENLFKEYIFVFSNINENQISIKEGISFFLTKYNEFVKEIKILNSKNDYFPEIFIQKLKDSIDIGKTLVIAKFKKNLFTKMKYLCVEFYEKGIETFISKDNKNKVVFNPADLIEDDLIKQRRDIIEIVQQEDSDLQEKKLIADEKRRLKLAKKGINIEELTVKKETLNSLETDEIDDQDIIDLQEINQVSKNNEFDEIENIENNDLNIKSTSKPTELNSIQNSQEIEDFVDHYLKESSEKENNELFDDDLKETNSQKDSIMDDDIAFLFKDLDSLESNITNFNESNQNKKIETNLTTNEEFDLINDDFDFQPQQTIKYEKLNILNDSNSSNEDIQKLNKPTNFESETSNKKNNFDFGDNEIKVIHNKFD